MSVLEFAKRISLRPRDDLEVICTLEFYPYQGECVCHLPGMTVNGIFLFNSKNSISIRWMNEPVIKSNVEKYEFHGRKQLTPVGIRGTVNWDVWDIFTFSVSPLPSQAFQYIDYLGPPDQLVFYSGLRIHQVVHPMGLLEFTPALLAGFSMPENWHEELKLEITSENQGKGTYHDRTNQKYYKVDFTVEGDEVIFVYHFDKIDCGGDGHTDGGYDRPNHLNWLKRQNRYQVVDDAIVIRAKVLRVETGDLYFYFKPYRYRIIFDQQPIPRGPHNMEANTPTMWFF